MKNWQSIPHDQCSIPSNVSVLSSIIIIKKLPGMKLSSIIINYHQLSSIIINYYQLSSSQKKIPRHFGPRLLRARWQNKLKDALPTTVWGPRLPAKKRWEHSLRRWKMEVSTNGGTPNGKHTKSYRKWPFIVDFPIEKWWFSTNGGTFLMVFMEILIVSQWTIPYKWRFLAGKIIYKWAIGSLW